MISPEISFYVDVIIAETILRDSKLNKMADASAPSALVTSLKDYFGSKIDPNNKLESLMTILAPGALSMLFSVLGFGKFGMLLGLALSYFHIDIGSIITSIWSSLKPSLAGNKPVSSQQIDSAVQDAVQSGNALETESFDQILHKAIMLRFAIDDYEKQVFRLTTESSFHKQANPFTSSKATSSMLGMILKIVFKVALASAGFMVAGDAIHKFLNQPNSFDKTYQYQAGAEQPSAPIVNTPKATQTKFPFKSDSIIPSVDSRLNNPDNISAMIVQWAKDVYSGLDGHEQEIMNTAGFEEIKDRIVAYNRRSQGDQGIFVPKMFTGSKRSVVDLFIDDVAKNAK